MARAIFPVHRPFIPAYILIEADKRLQKIHPLLTQSERDSIVSEVITATAGLIIEANQGEVKLWHT